MALYYHKLSYDKYASFLAEKRYDSITKEAFKDGDKVAICSHCKSASLLDVWLAYDKKHCNQEHSEIELNGNRGERYTRFTIDSESIVSNPVSKNIWQKIIDILLFIPLLILGIIILTFEGVVNILSFIISTLLKIGRWILIFILYFIGYSIVLSIFSGIVSVIFSFNEKQIEIVIGITTILAIIIAIGATNEKLE